MINRHVHKVLFGKPRAFRPAKKNAFGRNPRHVPWKQIFMASLIALMLASWLLDSFHVPVLPQSWHDAVAQHTDPYLYSLEGNSIYHALCAAVGHNPIDDSPITVGSILVCGVIVGAWFGFSAGTSIFREKD